MKKIFFTLICLCGSAWAYPTHTNYSSKPLSMIYQLEEGRQLIQKAEMNGPLHIKEAELGVHASSACWIPSSRTICLNISNERPLGTLIRSIVFELHNSLTNQEFDHWDALAESGKVSRDQYVEAIESIEYQNALQAKKILDKGVDKRIFPKEARWNIPLSFEEHFWFQKQNGHSAYIANLYDQITYSSSNTLAQN